MSPRTTDTRHGDERRGAPRVDPDEAPVDPHSRLIVDFLERTDGPVDVATLATEVAAALTDSQPEEVQRGVRRRVQTWFHHGQLPALDEAGIVEYDPDRGTVRLSEDRRSASSRHGSRGRR